MIRNCTFKVVLYLIQQNIIHSNRLLSTVENQSHPVIVKVDRLEKNVYDPPLGAFIILIAFLERIQKRPDLRHSKDDLLAHLHSKQAL